jgi:hypothetical protein
MLDTDSKIKQQAEWRRQHTLSQEQLKKLIAEKFERARLQREAVRKRETALQ